MSKQLSTKKDYVGLRVYALVRLERLKQSKYYHAYWAGSTGPTDCHTDLLQGNEGWQDAMETRQTQISTDRCNDSEAF